MASGKKRKKLPKVTRHLMRLAKINAEQAERLAHKEAAKQREVVDVVVRMIVMDPDQRGDPRDGRVIELETQCTRAELASMQAAHAADTLIINYVKEPAR